MLDSLFCVIDRLVRTFESGGEQEPGALGKAVDASGIGSTDGHQRRARWPRPSQLARGYLAAPSAAGTMMGWRVLSPSRIAQRAVVSGIGAAWAVSLSGRWQVVAIRASGRERSLTRNLDLQVDALVERPSG